MISAISTRASPRPIWCASTVLVCAEINHAQIEPHACLMDYDPIAGRLTAQNVSQVGYYLHLMLARCLEIDESRIRVIKPFVGGGFGARVEVLNFEIVTALLARDAGGKVSMQLTREETFITHRARPQTDIKLKLGMKQEGRLHRLRVRGGAARRRLCRLWHRHHSLCRRAAAGPLRHSGRQIRRLPGLRQSAALRRDARPRLGQRASRLRDPGRPHGARTRPRSVRGAPRQSAAGADPDDERSDGEQLRPRRMPRQGRARERMARAHRQDAAGQGPRHGLLALCQRIRQADPFHRRAARGRRTSAGFRRRRHRADRRGRYRPGLLDHGRHHRRGDAGHRAEPRAGDFRRYRDHAEGQRRLFVAHHLHGGQRRDRRGEDI